MRLLLLLVPIVPPLRVGPGRLVYHSAEAVAKLNIISSMLSGPYALPRKVDAVPLSKSWNGRER
jgi:hypothetical protein